MAYITTTDLQTFLQRSLTTAETAQAQTAIDTATALIDRRTGKSWMGGPATVSNEMATVSGGRLFLAHPPVQSVTSVSVRDVAIGATANALIAGTSYELLDAATGELLVAAADGMRATITYVTAQTVPAHIKYAAELIAAGLLLFKPDERSGIKSFSVPGDYSVTYTTSNVIPDEAASLLGRPVVRFA